MTVRQLAGILGARLLTAGRSADRAVSRMFAGRNVSGLLAAAAADTMLISGLPGAQLLRLAELMDAPAICLVEGVEVSPELVHTARGRGVALLVSPHGLEATAGLLAGALTTVEAG